MVSGMFGTIFLFLLPFSLAQTTNYGPRLTESALKIRGAISPTCETTTSCVQFVNDVIPRCQKLSGEAGCWCGNHDPLHFCAICMSNPTDNRTTADQTADALEGHQDYHIACNAFEAALNASSTASAGPSASSGTTATSAASNSGDKRAPVGAIVGGAIGGAIVVAIAITVLLLWLRQRSQSRIAPSKMSLFSVPDPVTHARPYTYDQPQPVSERRNSQYATYNNPFAPPSYTPSGVSYHALGTQSPGPEPMSPPLPPKY